VVGRACPCGGTILTAGGKSECDRCGPIASYPKPAEAYDSSPYRNSSRWKAEAARFKEANPFCVACAVRGIVNGSRGRTGLLVDHVIPVKLLYGGATGSAFWDKRNWQTLCLDCDLKYKKPLERLYDDPTLLLEAWRELLDDLRREANEEGE
jgi:5-methylcytosine-specific restriction endonuclease McrA